MKKVLSSWFTVHGTKREHGFTLIELLLVMGIAAILLTFISVNLLKSQRTTSLATAVDTLVADLKSQQIKAMNGTSADGSTVSSYGVTFGSGKYTLFHGETDPHNSTDFDVAFDGPLTVALSPAGYASELVYEKLTGEIKNFASPTTVTVSNGIETKVITVNKLGVITNVQ